MKSLCLVRQGLCCPVTAVKTPIRVGLMLPDDVQSAQRTARTMSSLFSSRNIAYPATMMADSESRRASPEQWKLEESPAFLAHCLRGIVHVDQVLTRKRTLLVPLGMCALYGDDSPQSWTGTEECSKAHRRPLAGCQPRHAERDNLHTICLIFAACVPLILLSHPGLGPVQGSLVEEHVPCVRRPAYRTERAAELCSSDSLPLCR